MVPIIGGFLGLADQLGDASHSRELDHLNEDAGAAKRRRDYLKGIQSAHCSAAPPTAAPENKLLSAQAPPQAGEHYGAHPEGTP